MKTKEYNILSIDFDYFVKASKSDIYEYYPDPIDLPTDISTLIWANIYCYKKGLYNLSINKTALKQTMKIIADNRDIHTDICKTMIVNSHKHLYDFIVQNYPPEKNPALNIYNIDMHHDMYDIKDDKTDIDCGNWGSHIKQQYQKSKIIWIQNRISNTIYSTKKIKIKPDLTTTKLSIISDIKFDLIFLCRSDQWLPPHLDTYFDDLKDTIQNNFKTTLIDKQIMTPRNLKPYIQLLKKETEQLITNNTVFQKGGNISCAS